VRLLDPQLLRVAGQPDDFGVSHVQPEKFGLFEGLIRRTGCSRQKRPNLRPAEAERAHPCRFSFFDPQLIYNW
jgi:hypothetical protein